MSTVSELTSTAIITQFYMNKPSSLFKVSSKKNFVQFGEQRKFVVLKAGLRLPPSSKGYLIVEDGGKDDKKVEPATTELKKNVYQLIFIDTLDTFKVGLKEVYSSLLGKLVEKVAQLIFGVAMMRLSSEPKYETLYSQLSSSGVKPAIALVMSITLLYLFGKIKKKTPTNKK